MTRKKSIHGKTRKDPNQAAFEANRQRLLKTHEGRYALFHDEKLVDTFDSMMSAHRFAAERFKLDPIFIGHLIEGPDLVSIPAFTHGPAHARP
jgi:hypothetical protein